MKKSHAGLSALDILITVLVLSVLLLAAAYQFGAYDGLSAQTRSPIGRNARIETLIRRPCRSRAYVSPVYSSTCCNST